MKKNLLNRAAKFLCVALAVSAFSIPVSAEETSANNIGNSTTRLQFENFTQTRLGAQKSISDTTEDTTAAQGSWSADSSDKTKMIYQMATANKYYYIEFDVNVQSSGYYEMTLNTKDFAGKSKPMQIFVDNTAVNLGTQRPGNTYNSLLFGSAYMNSGIHAVRIVANASAANQQFGFDYIEFTKNKLTNYFAAELVTGENNTATVSTNQCQKNHVVSIIKNMVSGDAAQIRFNIPRLGLYNIGLHVVKGDSWTAETVDIYLDNKLIKNDWTYTEIAKENIISGVQLDSGEHILSFRKNNEDTNKQLWLGETEIELCTSDSLLMSEPYITNSANFNAQSQTIEFENMTTSDDAYVTTGEEQTHATRDGNYIYKINGTAGTEFKFNSIYSGNYDVAVTYKTTDLSNELGGTAAEYNKLESGFEINGNPMGYTYYHDTNYAAIDTYYTINIGSVCINRGENTFKAADTISSTRYIVLDKMVLTPSENTTVIAGRTKYSSNYDTSDKKTVNTVNNNISGEWHKYVLINPGSDLSDYYAEFEVQIPSAGSYNMKIDAFTRINNGGIYDIYVNDTKVTEYTFTNTVLDKKFIEGTLGKVNLNRGINKIKLVLKGTKNNNYQAGIKAFIFTKDIVSNPEQDGTYYACAHIQNNSSAEKSAAIIFVHFAETESGLPLLENISWVEENNIAANSDTYLTVPLEIALKSGTNKFKIFAWDSLTGLVPVTPVSEITVTK